MTKPAIFCHFDGPAARTGRPHMCTPEHVFGQTALAAAPSAPGVRRRNGRSHRRCAAGKLQGNALDILAAFVDILIEMHWYAAPDEPDRRRRMLAWSRRDATPRQLLVELTADGADYVPAQDDAPAASLAATVRRLLTAEPDLTARDLLARWPADALRPS